MLERKIEQEFTRWKQTPNHNPLVVKGCRQCGKTFSVMQFANKHYVHSVYLNFYENPDFSTIFDGSLAVDNLIMLMTAYLGTNAQFEAGNTVIILDEIQVCPNARTALKFFKLDGRFDVICTGSLLGVSGYGQKPISIPVGYETIIEMNPLDFEEFLWANKIDHSIIDKLDQCIVNEIPVQEALHKRMQELLLQYTVVGGMPAVVQTFVDTKHMNTVLSLQRDIIHSYEDDMLKYAAKEDKPRIRGCFQSIPRQLAKENKKFQYTVIEKKGSALKFKGSLQWIEDAGIVSLCHNLHLTELPLDGNADNDAFKVYMRDTGLFVAMLEDGTQFDILNGNLLGYKGAISENIVADFFSKMGRRLYYFRKESGLEVDFVIRYKGQATLVEVKTNTGNTKSTKTILKHPEKYHVSQAIKLGNYNVGRSGGILSLPLYMGFLLKEQ